ncbi:F0F1 ATP synthase subunit gamma [Promicromonospora citrea]|uniref:ATP synthase gamma chain n=1 Tax=Promicromonospora citrea TaxID=43677 RepID=A0A8H9L4K7_9MICO|nr:F0F1 ATP synthase subunit gamma [Promicromonospora citrea]NNH51135.1 F0F1 ATP synthase subunit gamma [Promicromonospora citrea]GGM26979.1 ATP synthase gamma chain [Promicromonospora citrea]
MAGGSQRVYKARIRSTQSLKKMFRAQELIAASRIGKARAKTAAAAPYAQAITRAVSAVATHTNIDHPLTQEEGGNRAAVLVVSSDRGMAGSYPASIVREAERLTQQLEAEGKEVLLYVAGRRAVSYYTFRGRDMVRTWVYGSERPTPETAEEIAQALLEKFLLTEDEDGVSELHVVSTQFVNMVTQRPHVVRMLPLEVVEGVSEAEENEALPLYDFEPSPEAVLDSLLPRYVEQRIYAVLLDAAASELAARQRAMHTATDNAEDLIRTYTRLANQARQADITQEISEIVSGADALAS